MSGRSHADVERAALCAALGLGPESQRVEALAQKLDWEAVAARARESMLLPALAGAVKGSPGVRVPADLRASLTDALVHNEMQNQLLLHDLARTSESLASRGIASIAIKGASLIARFAGRAKLRHTDDIDLWVEPGREDDAFATLQREGFTLLGHVEPAPQALRYDGTPQNLEDEHQLPPLVSPHGTPVELHRFLPGADAIRWDVALEESETLPLFGAKVRLRNDAATLGDLCNHVVFHHMAIPTLWPRHVMDLADLVDARADVATRALAGRPLAERAAIYLSLAILNESRRSVEGGPLSRRLVFPSGAKPGWGAYRSVYHVVTQLRIDPANLARAAWPSPVFLRSQGYLGSDERPWRGRVRHLRRVVERVRSATE